MCLKHTGNKFAIFLLKSEAELELGCIKYERWEKEMQAEYLTAL